jgi:hypothetical protein
MVDELSDSVLLTARGLFGNHKRATNFMLAGSLHSFSLDLMDYDTLDFQHLISPFYGRSYRALQDRTSQDII